MALLGCGGNQEAGLVEEVGHRVCLWGVCLVPSFSCLSLLSSHHEVNSLLRPLLSLPHALPHQGSIAMEPAGHGLNTPKQSLTNRSCLKLFPEVFHHSSGKRQAMGRMCEEYTHTHALPTLCVVELVWAVLLEAGLDPLLVLFFEGSSPVPRRGATLGSAQVQTLSMSSQDPSELCWLWWKEQPPI